jgi:hypothetical protein
MTSLTLYAAPMSNSSLHHPPLAADALQRFQARDSYRKVWEAGPSA